MKVQISDLGRLVVEILNDPNLITIGKFQDKAKAKAIKELMDDSAFGDQISMELAAQHLEKYDNELFLEWRDGV